MSEPHFTDPPQPPAKEKSGCGKPALFGCLGIAVLFFVVAAGGVYWFMTKGKVLITESARESIVAEIRGSDLPQAQQQELITEIDRLAGGFASGEIGLKEMAVIMDEIGDSSLMTTIKLYGAQGDPLASSELSPEEREAAMTTLKRFAFGVFEERIPESAIQEIIDPLLVDPSDPESMRFRSDISPEELEAALAQAEAYADRAGISETDIEPDLARELRRIVDRVLQR